MKKRKKIKFGRIFIFVILILSIIYFCIKANRSNFTNDISVKLGYNLIKNDSKYKVVSEDTNNDYSGIRKRKSRR